MWKINIHCNSCQFEASLGYNQKFSLISCYQKQCDRNNTNNKSCTKGLHVTAIQDIQIWVEDILPVTRHRQTFLLIVILPPPSPCHSSDWPYLRSMYDLYGPLVVMSDELKVRLLGLGNSEKCTCLVIFNETAVKPWGQVMFFGLGDDLITH